MTNLVTELPVTLSIDLVTEVLGIVIHLVNEIPVRGFPDTSVTELPAIMTDLATELLLIVTDLVTEIPFIVTNLVTELPVMSTDLVTKVLVIVIHLVTELLYRLSSNTPVEGSLCGMCGEEAV